MKYYAYARVSTDMQVEDNSTQMQNAEIEKYCIANNIELSGSFEDLGISGSRVDRDGLLELFSVLEKGDKVIVQNTSRLWRTLEANILIKIELKKIGADVISIEQPTYSVYKTDDPNEFLINTILEVIDQYNRMEIAFKLSKGRKAKARNGSKACGSTPLGYKWVDTEIEIDESNADKVRYIFETYIQAGSYSKLIDTLNYNKCYTTAGKSFTKSSLSQILNNDFYIGIVTHAGVKSQGTHEPIISQDTWNKVQFIMGKNKKVA